MKNNLFKLIILFDNENKFFILKSILSNIVILGISLFNIFFKLNNKLLFDFVQMIFGYSC